MTTLCCNMLASKNDLAAITKPPTDKERKSWKEFQHTVNYLRSLCATPMPVRLRFVRLPNNKLGQCKRNKNHFVIELNSAMGQFQAIDVLVHEWAHALSWNYAMDKLAKVAILDPEQFDRACHDSAWGCAYSRVYLVHQEAIQAFDEK